MPATSPSRVILDEVLSYRRAAWGLALGWACAGDGSFPCVSDAQCADGAGALCLQGWCGFPDEVCASGYRYGDHAGDGLSGTCAPAPPTSDDGGSTNGSSGADPTEPDPASTAAPASTTLSLDGTTTEGPVDGTSGEASSSGSTQLPEPVAWYTFDDTDAPWNDTSGNGLHGWCGGEECGVTEPGYAGTAIRLDGFGDHGHVDHSPLLELYDGFTACVWALPDDASAQTQTIVSEPYGGVDHTWQFGLAPGSGDLFVGIHAGDWGGTTSTPWPYDGRWHHACAAWDTNVLRLYLDGQFVSSLSVAPIVFDRAYMLLGAADVQGSDVEFFGGLLDDLRLYDTALTDEEILVLAGQ